MGSVTHSDGESMTGMNHNHHGDGILGHFSFSLGEAKANAHTDEHGVSQLGDMDLGRGTTSNFRGDGPNVHAHRINAHSGANVNFKLMDLLQNLSADDDLDHEARKVIDDFGADGHLDLE